MKERRKNMYFDKNKIHDIWSDWIERRKLAEQCGDIPPNMPNVLMKKMYETAVNMSMAHNRIAYSYREDMVSEALMHMVRYAKTYNKNVLGKDGKPNPFGFLSKMIATAFNTVWEKEKNHEMIYKNLRTEMFEPWVVNDGGVKSDNGVDTQMQNGSDSSGLSMELYFRDMEEIAKYETRIQGKKDRAKQKKSGIVESEVLE